MRCQDGAHGLQKLKLRSGQRCFETCPLSTPAGHQLICEFIFKVQCVVSVLSGVGITPLGLGTETHSLHLGPCWPLGLIFSSL